MRLVTEDAADMTADPIVNLRDEHLINEYLHRASAARLGRQRPLPLVGIGLGPTQVTIGAALTAESGSF